MSSDITGVRFGRLVGVRPIGSGSHGVVWLLKCDCGNETSSIVYKLKRGRKKSCGCVRNETAASNGTLGLSNRREYSTRLDMLRRCYDPKRHNFHRYGGRGITVCDRWQNSLENFIEDMGPQPDGMTLDRIDNDGPYCKENCRWATCTEQALNRRSNRKLTAFGRVQTCSEWAKEAGIRPQTLNHRLNMGWSIEDAVSLPSDRSVRRPGRVRG